MPESTMPILICKKCGDPKPSDMFYRAAMNRTGRQTVCKDCQYGYHSAKDKAQRKKASSIADSKLHIGYLDKDISGLFDQHKYGTNPYWIPSFTA